MKIITKILEYFLFYYNESSIILWNNAYNFFLSPTIK